MAFDDKTRNRLQSFVSEARNLLTEEFTRQLQNDYGLDPTTGEVNDIESLTFLDDTRRQTARLLRDILDHYQASSTSSEIRESLERIVREQAFTVLNRLCALRMAEARDILIDSISNGYNSKGFQLYARVAGTALGETGDAYRNYLFSIFDEFALDLAVLFDRYSPMGRLFPRESVLLTLLDKINETEMVPLWAEDETIGWIYQYFNSKEERRQMRNESKAPRNSRELAVRNQFFTPRYVVEFLTDNTLGRIWYEMTQGKTLLKSLCRYLVRRPNEIFLPKAEEEPEKKNTTDNLSQEEILNQPAYIPYRQLKDPREIRMLDPACGSMHFGLYAFDLFEKIYEESWDIEGEYGLDALKRSGEHKPLKETYDDKASLICDVPRLIIEHNIHGVDIAPRAVQIAGLSLWLRAQRSWKAQKIKPADRPQVRKSNIVCAEPMPGEKDLLQEFTANLNPRVLGQLLEIIFDKMTMASEAGSLLKIEEEIEDAVDEAREEFNKELMRRKRAAESLFPDLEKPKQTSLFDFTDLPNKTQFWKKAEREILDALRKYAEQANMDTGTRKHLFVDDAGKGFVFIDICRKSFDVILMNPPFGEAPDAIKSYLQKKYPFWTNNLLCAAISRSIQILKPEGILGVIFDRTAAIKSSYENFRRHVLDQRILSVADTGWNVLDANVETTVHITSEQKQTGFSAFFDVRDFPSESKADQLLDKINKFGKGNSADETYLVKPMTFLRLPNAVVGYYFDQLLLDLFQRCDDLSEIGLQARKGHDFVSAVHFRLFWEVTPYFRTKKEKLFYTLYNGSKFSLFSIPIRDITLYGLDGTLTRVHPSTVFRNKTYQLKSGIGYGKRGDILDAHILCKDAFFTSEGLAITGIGNKKALLGLSYLNSSLAQFTINQYCGQHKQVGYVNLIPFPELSTIEEKAIIENCTRILEIKRYWYSVDETTLQFSRPFLGKSTTEYKKSLSKFVSSIIDSYEADLQELESKILQNDSYFEKAAKLTNRQIERLRNYISRRPSDTPWPDMNYDRGSNQIAPFLVKELLSNSAGTVVGRWDIRYAIGERMLPELLDPFDLLPICPSAMIQNKDGLPANYHDVPTDYPLRINWAGVMVDDKGHSEDIVARVREVFEVIWKEQIGDIEQEICEIIGVLSLRDYFRNPSNFFADHLKRYTKSRRQAPIYWPLSTVSGSFTLWLYYHHLTDQTLYNCVNDFVDPKLKQISEETIKLINKTHRNHDEEKKLEKLTNLRMEIKDFRDEMERVANFWKPNQNDGVQITAAPLWKLVQYGPWQINLKQTWEKLEEGDFDWAHLAYSIWPDRVIRASHKDHSYAIAHDLESDLWEEIENGTNRQGNPKYKWVSKDLNEQDLKTIIMEKSKGKS